MTDAEARAELGRILFSEAPRPPVLGVSWDAIVVRARVLVERIRKSQEHEATLTRVIDALQRGPS